jgi:N-acetylglucosamine-6-phosphate deacetylase
MESTRYEGRDYRTGSSVSVGVTGETIIDVRPEVRAEPGLWIAPALLDIQLNGFGGYGFNEAETSPESVVQVVRSQWRAGIGAFLPTVTTHSRDRMLRSVRAITGACRDPRIRRSILGIHLEGPHISPLDGPRGAHPLEHVRLPSWGEFLRMQEAADGGVLLVTLAPELEGTVPFIERLVDAGVVVAIGHTNASAHDLDAAIEAGARLSTHLGNGAHSLLPRHPNYIWEQLSRDQLDCSVIADGHHLPASVLKCILRCKGVERTILISDAVTPAGLPPGTYPAAGGEVEVAANGRISLAGTPYLAGAGAHLGQGVSNLVRMGVASRRDALRMASLHPARLLARDDRMGTLEAGKLANLIQYSWTDEGIRVHRTVVGGQVVFGDGAD